MTIDDHKKFMDEKVQHLLKPLMVDILKARPDNVLDFIVEWCQTKGSQIQKHVGDARKSKPAEANANPKEGVVADSQIRRSMKEFQKAKSGQLPSSDEDEKDVMEEELEETQEKVIKKQAQNKKKMAISAEAYGVYNQQAEFKAPVVPKSEEDVARIKDVLKMNFMFNTLEEGDLEIVIQAMNIREYQAGDAVIKQGDDGAELFIVSSGSLDCTKRFDGKEEDTFLKTYEVGDVFGELSLMYNAPRAASITAKTPSVLFSLDRDTFNHIVKTSAMKRRETYEEFLGKIDILADLQDYEKAKLCDCLKTEKYFKGDAVIREGEPGEKFYLIQSGTAEAVQKQPDGTEKVVFEYKENDYFGELALINNNPRKATIVVTSDKMSVATLDAKSFKRLLGPIEDILKRNSSKYDMYIKKV